MTDNPAPAGSRCWDVYCLGTICYDFLATVPHYPQWDEKAALSRLVRQGGGIVGTAAYAIGRLGARAALAGTWGDDEGGAHNRRELAAVGVDLRDVHEIPGAETQFAFVVIEETTGKRTIFYRHGTAGDYDPAWLNRESIASSGALLVNSAHMKAAEEALVVAGQAGVPSVVDAEGPHKHWDRLLTDCDYLVPSREFALQSTGESDPERAARRLLEAGPRAVVVTLGDRGSVGVTVGETIHQPAFDVPVVDTTGCGDVYHGAFALALAEGQDLAHAMRFASAVAALKCREIGGRAGCPTREEVAELLAHGAYRT